MGRPSPLGSPPKAILVDVSLFRHKLVELYVLLKTCQLGPLLYLREAFVPHPLVKLRANPVQPSSPISVGPTPQRLLSAPTNSVDVDTFTNHVLILPFPDRLSKSAYHSALGISFIGWRL